MATAAPASNPFASASLYVGDLRPEVTESLLFDVFKTVGTVASIRVCRDAGTRRSLGYAYVNYHSPQDADRALDQLNYSAIAGKPCRIMWSLRDPTRRRSGVGNTYIKNLDKSVNNQQLLDTFSRFGNILSCKVETDEKGQSKGYGYVHFEKEEDAKTAIEQVNGKLIAEKQVTVVPFVSRREREQTNGGPEARYTNVYVKGFPKNWDDSQLVGLFEKFGTITSCLHMKDKTTGEYRGFGFCNFENHESAVRAVEALNGTVIEGGPINETTGEPIKMTVCRAQSRSERDRYLKSQYIQKGGNSRANQGTNLYVRNLADEVDDEQLRNLFSSFGTITSARVMMGGDATHKFSKGFGFVNFSTAEEAQKALQEMNGSVHNNKPLVVAIAQRREERMNQLIRMHQGAYYPMNPGAWYPRGGMPQGMYPPMMRYPPRQFQQQMSGSRPYAHNSQYQVMMPSQPYNARPRGGVPNRGPMGPRPQGMGFPQGGAPGMVAQPGLQNRARPQPTMPRPYPPQPTAPQPVAAPVAAVMPPAVAVVSPLTAEEVALSSPDDLKNNVGERIFTYVSTIFPTDEAKIGKITGMLLESMDAKDLNQLLGNLDQLRGKVQEANDVLTAHANK